MKPEMDPKDYWLTEAEVIERAVETGELPLFARGSVEAFADYCAFTAACAEADGYPDVRDRIVAAAARL